MDTKSKSYRYSAGFKVLAFVMAALAVTLRFVAYFFNIFSRADIYGKFEASVISELNSWDPRIFAAHLLCNGFTSAWYKQLYGAVIFMNLGAALLFIAAAVYIVFAAGKVPSREEIKLLFFDRVPADLSAVIVVFINLATYQYIGHGLGTMGANAEVGRPLSYAYYLFVFMVLLDLGWLMSIARQFKAKRMFPNTLILSLFKLPQINISPLFAPCFLIALAPFAFIALALATIVLGGTIYNGRIYEDAGLFGVITTLCLIAAFVLLVFHFSSLRRFLIGVHRIAEDDAKYKIDSKYMTRAFSGLTHDIEKIQTGFNTAVDEAVRGERLKAELITNVSHDLKTPLTSIISYVDLLKKEPPANENAAKYIAVLDEKSQRLKKLTDDLIEASKAASGSVAVHPETIDLAALARQSLAEFDGRFKAAGLTVVAGLGEKPVTALCDGSLMWRVMSNLLSNAAKYAAGGSRIYISVYETDAGGAIEIKNVSSRPLNIPAERLLERFVRGDAARSTDGSGLGLPIAQSLAALQGGELKITIDGDLFKATVTMPEAAKG